MPQQGTIYTKKIIEIADFIFANPDKKMSDVLSYFVVLCRKNRRTVERYVRQAKEYNKTRLRKQEAIKDTAIEREIEKTVKLAIISRNDSLVTLSTIARGGARRIGDQIIIPTDGDRIRAIQQLSKMEGWDAPIKNANTDAQGRDIEPIIIEIIDSTYKVDGKDSNNESI